MLKLDWNEKQVLFAIMLLPCGILISNTIFNFFENFPAIHSLSPILFWVMVFIGATAIVWYTMSFVNCIIPFSKYLGGVNLTKSKSKIRAQIYFKSLEYAKALLFFAFIFGAVFQYSKVYLKLL